jgi:RNA polymerase sigma-70 factor (ECF subfamily)
MLDADDARISDETLLGRAVAGDPSAFDRLVRRHLALLCRFVRAAAPAADESDDAEPILRETILAARSGAGRYRDEPSVRAWLLALARREIDRRHPRVNSNSSSLRELAQAAGRNGPDWDAAAVASALAALSPEDREILTLCDRESFTLEEAARVTDLEEPALRARLHRARLSLLAKLAEGRHGG